MKIPAYSSMLKAYSKRYPLISFELVDNSSGYAYAEISMINFGPVKIEAHKKIVLNYRRLAPIVKTKQELHFVILHELAHIQLKETRSSMFDSENEVLRAEQMADQYAGLHGSRLAGAKVLKRIHRQAPNSMLIQRIKHLLTEG